MEFRNFYYGLEHKSQIVDDVKKLIDGDGWRNYYAFKAKPIPTEIVDKDPFFRWLRQRYKFRCAILNIAPNTIYDWHTDDRRGVCINMKLSTDDRSTSAFELERSSLSVKFHELQYEPNTYYVFNPQVTHFVINHHTERYIFSVEFERDDVSLSYEDLLEDIKFNWEHKYDENTLFNKINIENYGDLRKKISSYLLPKIKDKVGKTQFDLDRHILEECQELTDALNPTKLFNHCVTSTVYVIGANEYNLYSDILEEKYNKSILFPVNQDCTIKFFDNNNNLIKTGILNGPAIINERIPHVSVSEGFKPLVLFKIKLNKVLNLKFKSNK